MATAQAVITSGRWIPGHAELFARVGRGFFTVDPANITDYNRPCLNSATITRNAGDPVDVRNEAAIHMMGIAAGDTLTINVDHTLDYVANRIAKELAKAALRPNEPTIG